jgi:hypothetical protein
MVGCEEQVAGPRGVEAPGLWTGASALMQIEESTSNGLTSQTGMPARKKRSQTVRFVVKTPMMFAVVGGYICVGVDGSVIKRMGWK